MTILSKLNCHQSCSFNKTFNHFGGALESDGRPWRNKVEGGVGLQLYSGNLQSQALTETVTQRIGSVSLRRGLTRQHISKLPQTKYISTESDRSRILVPNLLATTLYIKSKQVGVMSKY